MATTRRISTRRTLVRRQDLRRGEYRQTIDWPSAASMYQAMAGRIPTEWSIEYSGRVENPATFDYASLVEMASLHPTLGFGISLTDLAAQTGVQANAEVLVASDCDGRSIAVPMRAALASDAARLTLGSRHEPIDLSTGFPARLDVPGWTEDLEPISLTSLEAVGFAEFVRCR